MDDSTAAAPNYGVYLKVWAVLLVITLLMVFFTAKAVLIAGMTLKALLIALWFMHLRYEKLDFVLYVLVSIGLFSLVLFGLIAPDGLVM